MGILIIKKFQKILNFNSSLCFGSHVLHLSDLHLLLDINIYILNFYGYPILISFKIIF